MYCPQHFVETDHEILRALIEQNNFGTLVSVVDGLPFATHLPFLYEPENQRLLAHMARANPHWQALDANDADALVIFQGPHAYVSPGWYQSPGVPTWNYTAVHIYGSFSVIDDPLAHRNELAALAAKHEAGRTEPWQPDFDSALISGMVSGTVAFQILITEIQGKFKLSQNRSEADRANVIRELEHRADGSDRGLAELMRARQ